MSMELPSLHVQFVEEVWEVTFLYVLLWNTKVPWEGSVDFVCRECSGSTGNADVMEILH